jgi:beta-N-acetylhexosaminidase
VLLIVLTTLLEPKPAVQAETQFQTSEAQAVLDSMTPEERVGQLFLVTFQGTDPHDQTEIYDLIANHHVGGVVLQAANDNFLPQPDTIDNAHQLIRTLQTIESDATTAPQS